VTATGFPQRVIDQIDDRSMGWCEVCGEYRVQEHHHRRPRGMGGSRRDDTNRASNGLGLCSGCHRMCEQNRTVAKLLGWLIAQGADPTLRPVIYRGQKALLTDEGSIEYLEVAA
jgi:5-methylcytosine-specific restriction protein A